MRQVTGNFRTLNMNRKFLILKTRTARKNQQMTIRLFQAVTTDYTTEYNLESAG